MPPPGLHAPRARHLSGEPPRSGLPRVLLGGASSGSGADARVAAVRPGSPPGDGPLWALVPPMRADDAAAALATAVAAGAAGIVIGDAVGRHDLDWAGARLAVIEAEADLPDGSVRTVMAVESAAGTLALSSLAVDPPPRLAALLLRPDRLAAALGCAEDAAPIAAARGAVVLAAAAAGVPAWLEVGAEADRLAAAARDGFAGVLVSDPDLLGPARTAFG